jgi:hypothetical protein
MPKSGLQKPTTLAPPDCSSPSRRAACPARREGWGEVTLPLVQKKQLIQSSLNPNTNHNKKAIQWEIRKKVNTELIVKKQQQFKYPTFQKTNTLTPPGSSPSPPCSKEAPLLILHSPNKQILSSAPNNSIKKQQRKYKLSNSQTK